MVVVLCCERIYIMESVYQHVPTQIKGPSIQLYVIEKQHTFDANIYVFIIMDPILPSYVIAKKHIIPMHTNMWLVCAFMLLYNYIASRFTGAFTTAMDNLGIEKEYLRVFDLTRWCVCVLLLSTIAMWCVYPLPTLMQHTTQFLYTQSSNLLERMCTLYMILPMRPFLVGSYLHKAVAS